MRQRTTATGTKLVRSRLEAGERARWLAETVFTRPGLGKKLVGGMGARDYLLVQGPSSYSTKENDYIMAAPALGSGQGRLVVC